MHYLITGGTGFIGSALVGELVEEGHDITIVSRQRKSDRGRIRYVGSCEEVPDDSAIDTVVNLAGASLAGKRWSERYKREIIDSRLDSTAQLIQLLERLERKPAVLLSASAVGYYGHHGDETLAEDGAVKPGFSHDLCKRWEAAARSAEAFGVRVCLLRLGVVLDRDGGAMEQMAQPFKFGIANWLGDGRQWLSWVHRQDVVRAVRYLEQRDDLTGPFNITAPEPVNSRGFCTALKRHYRTFLTLPMPAPVMRALVGEMADELLLRGQRVVPAALESAGFSFRYPRLDSALQAIVDS
jgi:uncharacterized protein (TIGR01777 family)